MNTQPTNEHTPEPAADQPSPNMVVVSLVVTLSALLIAVAGVSYYIWYGMQYTPAGNEPAEVEENTDESTLATTSESVQYTEVEKLEILESLEANPDGLTEEEKRTRLEAAQQSSSEEITVE